VNHGGSGLFLRPGGPGAAGFVWEMPGLVRYSRFRFGCDFELGMLQGKWLRGLAEGWERRTLRGFDCVSTISATMVQRTKQKGVEGGQVDGVAAQLGRSGGDPAPGHRGGCNGSLPARAGGAGGSGGVGVFGLDEQKAGAGDAGGGDQAAGGCAQPAVVAGGGGPHQGGAD